MSKRRENGYVCREKEIARIEETMSKFQQMGLVGESHIAPDGDIGWRIGPEHADKIKELLQVALGQPERWDEIPAFKRRKSEMLLLRQQAIEKGWIS